jgi:hypothetical protein
VTDIGALERERSAATPRSQPDCHHHRDRDGEPVATIRLQVRDLRVGQPPVTDQTGADEDRDTAEQRGQVRLVERVDPVDVSQALATPNASPLE